jgi:hypothetical protein
MKDKLKIEKPDILTDIDLTDLCKICKEYIDFVSSDEYCEDNDYPEYIFQEALMTVFGPNVFRYFINKVTE